MNRPFRMLHTMSLIRSTPRPGTSTAILASRRSWEPRPCSLKNSNPSHISRARSGPITASVRLFGLWELEEALCLHPVHRFPVPLSLLQQVNRGVEEVYDLVVSPSGPHPRTAGRGRHRADCPSRR